MNNEVVWIVDSKTDTTGVHVDNGIFDMEERGLWMRQEKLRSRLPLFERVLARPGQRTQTNSHSKKTIIAALGWSVEPPVKHRTAELRFKAFLPGSLKQDERKNQGADCIELEGLQ